MKRGSWIGTVAIVGTGHTIVSALRVFALSKKETGQAIEREGGAVFTEPLLNVSHAPHS